jgi:hypothetical protein
MRLSQRLPVQPLRPACQWATFLVPHRRGNVNNIKQGLLIQPLAGLDANQPGRTIGG